MSSASDIIRAVADAGGRLSINHGKLRVELPEPVNDDLVTSIRECREELIEELAVAPEAPSASQRLDWWNAPVEGWREGRLVLRNIVFGKETVIHLPMKRTRH